MTAAPVTGWIHSVETGGAVDGPGLRYVLFLAGCALRCQYCHNPDTWHRRGAKAMSSADVLADIASLASFLRHGGGGLTLTGGEPLVQAEFCGAVLRGCKEMGLHTALDTSGFLGRRATDALLADVDLVLLDIKHADPQTYRRVTGQALQPTLDFARRLARLGKPMWIRYVLVPGLTDGEDDILRLADIVVALGPAVERVEVLPFHQLGRSKWERLGLKYPLADTPTPTGEQVARARSLLASRNLTVF